ncbi:MAG TPA: hypothetical protein VJB96_00800 [Patescibacteria group bacterium]|nr:hypothetical protein [Patescibacteria group bacterium]
MIPLLLRAQVTVTKALTAVLFSAAFIIGIGPLAVGRKLMKYEGDREDKNNTTWEKSTGSRLLNRMY